MSGGRDFDIVVYGATGFTGAEVAKWVQRKREGDGGQKAWDVRWAIAGRSEQKLLALQERHALSPDGVLMADVTDEAALAAMTARCRLLLNCTGPYRFFGEPIVAACIKSFTDYIDLCGEPEFMDRCLLKYGDAAKAAGVVVMHGCAFDSVPADIGTLFTAMQFKAPARCAHLEMFHTVSPPTGVSGAGGHVTTFVAAVNGFGGVEEYRNQRKALMEKLDRESPGSSNGPSKIGPKLRAKQGPFWNKRLSKYCFLFPGADSAVVRSSQRTLAALLPPEEASRLSPQFGAYFCVSSLLWTAIATLLGLVFNFLAARSWGRKLLLAHPGIFTLGMFSELGPSQEMLKGTTFQTHFFGAGYSNYTGESGPFDKRVRCSIAGPEPGYVATPLLFLAVARFMLEDRAELAVRGGVFTPGGALGASGARAVEKLVARCDAAGVRFVVEGA